MNKLGKVLGIGVLLALFGILVFGAVNYTLAKSEGETTTEIEVAGVVDEPDYGQGNRGVSYEGIDHEINTIPIGLIPSGEVDQSETDALLYMREEEKLARDVYQYFATLWGMPSFANIAKSEQVHMDSVLDLINRYELADPAVAEAGVFTNPDLQELYDQLIAQGSISVEEAFRVGAAIEEIDILDLQTRLSQTDQADIQQVFESLMLGSYNHLNAFVTNLSNRYGLVYVPQYLSTDLYQEIVLDSGTGNGTGGGFGNGRGGGGNNSN